MTIKSLPESLRNSQKVFSGVRFDVHTVELKGENGNIRRDVVIHPGAVCILPLLKNGDVVMIRNERFAVGKELWELPAGTLEPNEPPIETAKRELIEETGYEAKEIKELMSFYTTPGFTNEIMYGYLAENLIHVGQNLDENEKIRVEVIEWKKIMKMIRDGTICDGKTIAILLYYQVYIQNVRDY
ncbi:MAG: NUDIX hydrolase [Parachlamydiaceae bacterium]|nr:NUDIX hydrolase [Parachlamydiaceae bacterium]